MSLHSAYNPVREAERYVEAQGFPFKPLYIIVTEPGESYLASAFRARYPDACLVAIRYTESRFTEFDGLWDSVWRPGTSRSCHSFLFGLIGDEYLPLAAFVRWKPSDGLWPREAQSVWAEIARLYSTQKAVMHTRSHFGRRWLANMFRNAISIETVIDMEPPEQPVFLALAGPSLESQFPFNPSDFFVCAASSALSCLVSRGYVPDLCVSTDGGNWARSLFDAVAPGIPVAFPLEAAIPSGVLEENPCVMLDYGGALECDILSIAGISGKKAERNGTIAGTAAMYFIEHANVPIYAAGLDLCDSGAYSHARPHPSIDRLDAATGRMNTLCGELYARGAHASSLDTYASWFSSRDDAFKSRFFRLAPVRRPIDGIGTVDLRDVAHAERSAAPRRVRGERQQRIRETRGRADGLREYAERFRAVAERCRRTANPADKAVIFGSELDVSSNGELLRMVSYTGYVNCLKASRALDPRTAERGLAVAIDRLCEDALTCSESLIGKASIP